MACLSIFRAVTVRLLFACHGLISVWRLYVVTNDSRYWYLAISMGLLLLEMIITVFKRGGKEWKWFCPSVFIYLLSSVPAIWFLELREMNRRILLQTRVNSSLEGLGDSMQDLHSSLGSVLGVEFELRIPIEMSSDQWIRTLEQILLLILIIGRWLLPKGKLTHDQLSQLLLVYIGTAADIVEFFEAFKEETVRYNRILCISILGIWSLSLVQFTLVLTAARARRDQSGLLPRFIGTRDKNPGCCSADVHGILISILLQDLPFLCLRLLLIFNYRVVSYTNMFFTSKNTLVIILLLYRLVVVYIERHTGEEANYVAYDPTRHSRYLHSDNLSIPDSYTGSNASKSQLLKRQVVNGSTLYGTQERIYQLRQEKHKWGRAYHFEEINSPM